MKRPGLGTGLWLALVLCGTQANGTASGGCSSDLIRAETIQDRVYFLTSEALEGRYPGSRGYRTAADYASSQFRAAGLLPVVGGGTEPRDYLQPVPLARRTVKDAATVTIRTPSGETTFGGEAFKIFTTEGLAGDGTPLPVVFAGFGIREPAEGWNDLDGLEVRGKVVLILMGAPTKDDKPVLSEPVHALYAPTNSIFRKQGALRGAAAVIAPPYAELVEAFPVIPAFPEEPRFVLDDPEPGNLRNPLLAPVSFELARALFAGRELPGVGPVSEGRIPRGDLEGVTMAIHVPLVDEKVKTWNVLGLVEGTDPVLKDQVVVVSAHLDHLPPATDGRIHPGANDDASGAAALMEIARAVAADPPRRSVLFALFGAEEGGSMGARHFLARGPIPRERIVADLNMDQIGRTEEDLLSDRAHYAIDSGRVTPAFARLIDSVNSRTVNWPLRTVHPLNLGVSDHFSFESAGIPAVNFYSGRVPETHTPSDTPDTLDYEKAEKIARLVCEIARELAGRDPLWG